MYSAEQISTLKIYIKLFCIYITANRQIQQPNITGNLIFFILQ